LIFIKLFLTAFFWGGTFIAGRFIAGQVGPFSAAFLRFAIASFLLLVFIKKTEGSFPPVNGRQIYLILLLGLSGVFAYNVFFFRGLQLIEASRAALIIANNPILITLLSVYFFRERLTLINGLGIGLSVCGAMIVISRGNLFFLLQEPIGQGDLFIFGCVASWGAFSILGKYVTIQLSPLISVAYASAVGSIMLFIPACLEGMFQDWKDYSLMDWGCLIYLGIFGTVIGFIWYYDGIKAIGPSKAGLFINFVPVSAVLLAFFLLNEPLTASLLVGALLIISGVYLANQRRQLAESRSTRQTSTPVR
jgi:drug/metabolite transporter (DMT)-like permease